MVVEEMLSRKRTEISNNYCWSSKFREVSNKCNTESEIQYYNLFTIGMYDSYIEL
jgi:hypothetical protein